MLFFRFVPILLLSLLVFNPSAQSVFLQKVDSLGKTSIRGLCVVDDQVIWCSGSKGFVALRTSVASGFKPIKVNGYEHRDFRAVEAFDNKTAIIMAVGEPAILLKTVDAGIHWKKVFEDSTKGMFLDALRFSDTQNGTVIGDPIDGSFFVAQTHDGGETWLRQTGATCNTGEALFAASNGNIGGMEARNKNWYFISGGMASKLYANASLLGIPIPSMGGKASKGANAMAMLGNRKGIIVGGDFDSAYNSFGNTILFKINGNDSVLFSQPRIPPLGYKSSVISIDKRSLVACGTSGVDVSFDKGMHWSHISDESYHVVRKARKGATILLAGSNGRLAELLWHPKQQK